VRQRLDFKRISPWAFDITLTAVLLVLGLITLFVYRPDSVVEYRDPDWIGVTLITATTVPIALRRPAPLAVALVLAALNAPFLVWNYSAPVAAVVAAAAGEPVVPGSARNGVVACVSVDEGIQRSR
jgi:hypothetical protein